MRLFAQKKGYSLSDFGPHPTIRSSALDERSKKNQKIQVGYGIPCETDEDIFKALHLQFKKPEQRDVLEL